MAFTSAIYRNPYRRNPPKWKKHRAGVAPVIVLGLAVLARAIHAAVIAARIARITATSARIIKAAQAVAKAVKTARTVKTAVTVGRIGRKVISVARKVGATRSIVRSGRKLPRSRRSKLQGQTKRKFDNLDIPDFDWLTSKEEKKEENQAKRRLIAAQQFGAGV